MKSVSGKVVRFLHHRPDQVSGFILDRGQEVRFWLTSSNAAGISALLALGSQVEVQGDLREEGSAGEYFQAALITNLDSKKSLSVLAPVHLNKPGMPFVATPPNQASLAHLGAFAETGRTSRLTQAESSPASFASTKSRPFAQSSRNRSAAMIDQTHPGLPPLPPASKLGAAAAIARAFDGLQRLQALLAYLKIVRRDMPGTGQLFHEAAHTYEQALRRYKSDDFECASEFAAASLALSLVVEIIISRTLRADTTYPSLVPPPPEHAFAFSDSNDVQEVLDRVSSLLSRIHWLLKNGTLPLEDRAQVRRIASWSETLYAQARRTYGNGAQDDAAELLQAANAAANSAEHICRKWYVSSQSSVPPASPSRRAS